jgi:hypothetical protein
MKYCLGTHVCPNGQNVLCCAVGAIQNSAAVFIALHASCDRGTRISTCCAAVVSFSSSARLGRHGSDVDGWSLWHTMEAYTVLNDREIVFL